MEEQNQNMAPAEPQKSTPAPITTEPQTSIPPVENTYNEKPQGKAVKIILIILILIIILAFAAYFYITSNPKLIFKIAVEEGYSKYETVIDKVDDFSTINLKDPMLLSGNLTFNTKMDELKDYDGMSLDYKVGKNPTDKIAALALELTNNNKKIEASANLKEDKTYISLEDMFDKTITTDEYNYDKIFKQMDTYVPSVSLEDLKYIVTTSKGLMLKAFDKVEFSKNSTTTNLNGKDEKVTELKLELNESNTKIISDVFINGILKDEKFVNILANIEGIEVSEEKEKLNDSKNNFEFDAEDNTIMSVYTKGFLNQIVKVAITNSDGTAYYSNYDKIITLEGDDTKITITNKTDVVVLSEDEKVLEGTIKEFSNKKIDIDYKTISFDKESGNGNITINISDKKIDTSVKYKQKDISNTKVEFSMEKESNNKYNCSFAMDLKGYFASKTELDFGFKTINTIEKATELPIVDIKDPVDYKELTTADQQKIMLELSSKIEELKLSSLIQMFEMMSTPTIDYNSEDDIEFNV